jgi:citronellol/citronellal dehydrogenase
MTGLSNRTIFITGGSRGIGRAIALRAARDGANVVIAAKTAEPHPKLPGTIYSVASEIEAAGGRALPVVMDVRDDAQVKHAVEQTIRAFGGIDVLVNNASAVHRAAVVDTPVKRYDLMFDINVRGTFLTSRACIPYRRASADAHILTLSPPLDLDPGWFADHTAYTMSKYAMSMTVLGLAAELASSDVSVNALWPQTMIYTDATAMFGLGRAGCRTPEIMADAAHAVLTAGPGRHTGQFLIDETVLREAGVTDFGHYDVVGGAPLIPDLFVGPASERHALES